MSGDLTALAATWAGLAGSTTLAKLQAINALKVATSADLPLDVVIAFIRNSGKLAGIAAFVNNTPATPDAAALKGANYLMVLLSGNSGSVIPAAQIAPLLAIIDAMSNDARTGVTAGNVTAFNNICQPAAPWWQANGFAGPITLFDLIAAGNLS